jgi:hypothetical protein
MLYEIKVEIQGIEPCIWRVIRVPPRTSLRKLHRILQKAMGWTNSHLHLFKVDGKQYGEPNPEWDFEVLDEGKLTLEKIFTGGIKSFQYEYDLGDDWVHEITLIRQIESEETKPGCIDGARACPPEDCGGEQGYYNFLVALADPDNEEHESTLEWVGGNYDPNFFDTGKVDRALKRLR